MTDGGETGTTHFSLPGFFSKVFHSNDLIFVPMEDMSKEKTCAKYLRKISIFQEVMNKRNLKRK